MWLNYSHKDVRITIYIKWKWKKQLPLKRSNEEKKTSTFNRWDLSVILKVSKSFLWPDSALRWPSGVVLMTLQGIEMTQGSTFAWLFGHYQCSRMIRLLKCLENNRYREIGCQQSVDLPWCNHSSLLLVTNFSITRHYPPVLS